MDVVKALRAHGGVARTAALLAAGCTSRQVAIRVRAGEVHRLRRGIFALAGADPTLVRAIDLGGVVTCASALAHHGVALLSRPDQPHVAVEQGFTSAARNIAGVRLHYVRPGSLTGAEQWHDVVTGLDEAGRCLTQRAHLVAIDHALHNGLVRPDQIAAFTRSPMARRDWLLAHADARAESPPESLMRLALMDAGLAVHPQRFISGVGRVDFVVEDSLVVEVDGQQHHDDPRAFQRDRSRDRQLVREGYAVLRFTYADICGRDSTALGAEVRAAIAAVRSSRSARA